MIQRIQHFLLVLAACGIALMFMFPTATFQIAVPEQEQPIGSDLGLIAKHSTYDPESTLMIPTYVGQQDTPFKGTVVMVVLAALIGVICIATIFFYKNRMLQMRMVAVAFLLNVIYIALTFLWFVDGYAKAISAMSLGEAVPHFSVGTYAPIATAALIFFAQRGIKKDELKVRAADRLR